MVSNSCAYILYTTRNPFRQADVLFRILRIGVKNILNVGLAVGEIESLDVRHGGKHADDGFVGFDVSHGMLRIGRVGMNTKFFIDEAFDAGLQAVFEAVFTGGDSIINGAASEVLIGKEKSVHLAVNSEIILHRALGKSHFGLVGALDHAVVAERDYALVMVDNDAAHFG